MLQGKSGGAAGLGTIFLVEEEILEGGNSSGGFVVVLVKVEKVASFI